MQKVIVTTALLFTFIFNAIAQNKDELQKQRQQLKKDIEETERALNETKKTTKENVGQLSLINKRIDLQGNVIDNISSQLKYIEGDIYRSQKEVNRITRVLDTLKQEYAKSMVYAYKNRNSYDFLNFIFAASSFNDAIKRITYLKSYRSYREIQGENIVRTKLLLQQRIMELSGNKQQKNIALEEKNKEMTVLEKQQEEKEKIVAKLKSRQKELSVQINNKRRQDVKLKNMISVMIRNELAKERDVRNNNNNTATTTTSKNKPSGKLPARTETVPVSSEADRALDANFERNRGSLPWPADGFIISHFGPNQIPGGNIIYDDPGVTIGTQVGASVKAIFDGEVTLVNYIEDKQVVFIKHGKYFSVYSNLSSASVQKGQSVKTGQVIGRAAGNDDGQGQVNFILMKQTSNVNPEQWLRRK